MLIPHLHFNGDCVDAIALYERAFSTKAYNYDYRDNKIAHARMNIHGQTIWLNDAKEHIKSGFGSDCSTHLVLTFNTPEELLNCYENFKTDENAPVPFHETPYSKLVGNFMDKFGVLWGFMVVVELMF
jgi:PhnB protein